MATFLIICEEDQNSAKLSNNTALHGGQAFTTIDQKISRIMRRFQFDEKLQLGIPVLDQQHERFIDHLNTAWEVQEKGGGNEALLPVLADLVDYALMHFADEEDLMQGYEYPDYMDHREMHNSTATELFDFDLRLLSNDPAQAQQFLDFLIGWLENHIQNTDRKLADFLKEKGVSQ